METDVLFSLPLQESLVCSRQLGAFGRRPSDVTAARSETARWEILPVGVAEAGISHAQSNHSLFLLFTERHHFSVPSLFRWSGMSSATALSSKNKPARCSEEMESNHRKE